MAEAHDARTGQSGARGARTPYTGNSMSYPDPGRPDFCARCATRLHSEPRGGRDRPVCPACYWVYYAKPALGAAILVEQDDRVLLVQRAHDPYLGQWMLPAGFVEYGEFAQESAVREALEETGLRVELQGIFGFYFGVDDPRNVAHLCVYVATVIGGTLTAGDDASDARFFARDARPAPIAFAAHRQTLADWAGGPRPQAPLANAPEGLRRE